MSAATFAPNHTIPEGGLDAWDSPDPALSPTARLDSWLDVQVTATNGGWARVLCANGWSAWVDWAALVPVTVAPRSVGDPLQGAVPVAAPLGVTNWMALGGGAVVAVAGLLPWVSLNLGGLGSVSANAFKAPLELLWNAQAGGIGQGATSPLTIGLALLATGVAGAALVFAPGFDIVRRAAGGLAVFMASDFVQKMSAAAGQLSRGGAQRISVFSILGIGVYVALLGGALMLIGTARKPAPGQK